MTNISFVHDGGVINIPATDEFKQALIELAYRSTYEGAAYLDETWDEHIGHKPESQREIQAEHGLVYMVADEIKDFYSDNIDVLSL